MSTLEPTPTITLVAVKPGEWTASAQPLGELVFKVSPDSAKVTLVSVNFTQFQCEGYGLDGKWEPNAHTGEITDRHFTMSGQITGYIELSLSFPPGTGPTIQYPNVTIYGGFDERGTDASGTWKVDWDRTSCSGAWNSSEAGLISKTTEPSSESYYLYPFCNCREEVPAGQVPTLRWGWITATETYTRDFIKYSKTTITIDGVPYSGLEGYWSKIAYSDEDKGYKSMWIYPLPPVSPGVHHVVISISLDRAVTDGYDSNGDGKEDEFGPGEAFYGWVDVNLTKTTGLPTTACSNGAPAGHWALIVIKDSLGDGEIKIDGKPVSIRNGKNVIYLTANESHAIQIGSSAVNYSAPECGENTLNVP